ncbi:hypothetical protein BRC75_01190 [Halobacteriales archaeon QH_7_69_31]|nr:MAG: hypothetical protein BRC75_01190 [Halobacteriales archaeon QH_7_69_31]
MLGCSPPDYLEVPTPRGFTVDEGTWRCDIARFEQFLAAVGGVEGSLECDGDCYVAGSRLEGFIAQRQAGGEWNESLTEAYPDVESLAEIEALALFFRTCQADREQGSASLPGTLQV